MYLNNQHLFVEQSLCRACPAKTKAILALTQHKICVLRHRNWQAMAPHHHVLVLGKLDRFLHFFKSTKISRQALVLKLLVSGGVGYIGTHSIIEIMNAELNRTNMKSIVHTTSAKEPGPPFPKPLKTRPLQYGRFGHASTRKEPLSMHAHYVCFL